MDAITVDVKLYPPEEAIDRGIALFHVLKTDSAKDLYCY